jgi:hypothetical protein
VDPPGQTLESRENSSGSHAAKLRPVKLPWYPELWSFVANEVSAGVYEAIADDGPGHRIRFVGTDPDELLKRVRREAAELTAARREAAADQ